MENSASQCTTARWIWALLVMLLWPYHYIGAVDESCMVYSYIEKSGKLVKTSRKDSVPPEQRAEMMTYQDCALAKKLGRTGVVEERLPEKMEQVVAAEPPKVGTTPGASPVVMLEKQASTLVGKRWERKPFGFLKRPNHLGPWWKVVLSFFLVSCFLVGLFTELKVAFTKGFWWVLGVLLFWPATIPFAAKYWEEAGTGFLVNLFGLVGMTIMILLVL